MKRVKKNTQYELNEFEIKVCENLARWNDELNNDPRYPKPAGEGEKSFLTRRLGYGSEIAFSRMFNLSWEIKVPVLWETSNKSNTDTSDFKTDDGIVIDVKTTFFNNYNLIADRSKNVLCHYYALVTGPFPIYTFRGFIRPVQVFREEYKASWISDSTYLVNQGDLFETIEEAYERSHVQSEQLHTTSESNRRNFEQYEW